MSFRWDAMTISQFEKAIGDYRALILAVGITLGMMIVVGVYLLFAYFNSTNGQWWLVALSWVISGGFAIHLHRLVKHRNKLIRLLAANSLCPRKRPGEEYEVIGIDRSEQKRHGDNDSSEGQQQPSG